MSPKICCCRYSYEERMKCLMRITFLLIVTRVIFISLSSFLFPLFLSLSLQFILLEEEREKEMKERLIFHLFHLIPLSFHLISSLVLFFIRSQSCFFCFIKFHSFPFFSSLSLSLSSFFLTLSAFSLFQRKFCVEEKESKTTTFVTVVLHDEIKRRVNWMGRERDKITPFISERNLNRHLIPHSLYLWFFSLPLSILSHPCNSSWWVTPLTFTTFFPLFIFSPIALFFSLSCSVFLLIGLWVLCPNQESKRENKKERRVKVDDESASFLFHSIICTFLTRAHFLNHTLTLSLFHSHSPSLS